MRARKAAALALTGAIAAGGAGVAIGATTADKGKAAEDAVIKDAAGRLGTSPEKLRQALSTAEDAQLDAAVKAGELTQAQADAIKQHRQQEGTVLDLGPGGGPGHGGHGGRFLLADAAKAIGISEDTLMTQLRNGTTLTAVAKAHG